MDTIVQALIMGIVQGLTEFLPVSSSGHLLIVPRLFGWDDAFIASLPFSVMLHLGTLGALLVYFRSDWFRIIPAGFAAIRDRSFEGDPTRRLAWLLVAATIPAALAGFLLNDLIEERFHGVGPETMLPVAFTLVDRWRDPLAGRPLRPTGPAHRGRDVPDRARHRRRPGAGADPRDQPLGDLDLRVALRGAEPRVGGPLQLPHGDPDHGRGHHLRVPPTDRRRARGPGRARSRCSSACCRRSSPACSRSGSCCATCVPTP